VRLDLSGVERMDSAGAAFCALLQRRVAAAGGTLELSGVSPAARDSLSVFRVRDSDASPGRRREGFFERVGGSVYSSFLGFVLFAVLVTDTFYATVTGFFGRRQRVRLAAIIEQMIRIGLESFAIVGLISFLVGLTVSLQSAVQLAQFGANIFLVDLIALGMTRELGPLITAIILAGRCGSSIAAELATMVITEEVDALRTMGVQPVRFLVVPRYIAISIMQPLLTMMANLLGILGGFVIALVSLEIGPEAFGLRLMNSLMLWDIVTGLIKSVAFAWIIVFVGAHRGFQVYGGAVGVGKATTDSVVQAIFAVIVADAFFSIIFYL